MAYMKLLLPKPHHILNKLCKLSTVLKMKCKLKFLLKLWLLPTICKANGNSRYITNRNLLHAPDRKTHNHPLRTKLYVQDNALQVPAHLGKDL